MGHPHIENFGRWSMLCWYSWWRRGGRSEYLDETITKFPELAKEPARQVGQSKLVCFPPVLATSIEWTRSKLAATGVGSTRNSLRCPWCQGGGRGEGSNRHLLELHQVRIQRAQIVCELYTQTFREAEKRVSQAQRRSCLSVCNCNWRRSDS